MDKENRNKIKTTISIPIRVLGKTTSITLKKNIVSLWILLMDFDIDLNKEAIKYSLMDFVYNCLISWKGNSAKGLSDFVTEKMIISFLEEKDLLKYRKIKKELRVGEKE